MSRSLRWRMIVVSALVIIAALSAVAVLLGNQARHRAAVALEERLLGEAQALTVSARALSQGTLSPQAFRQAYAGLPAGDLVTVVLSDGEAITAPEGVTPSVDAPEFAGALAGSVTYVKRKSPLTGQSQLHVAVPFTDAAGATLGAVRVTGSRAPIAEAARDVLVTLVYASLAALAATFLASLWFTTSLGRALAHLGQVARRLAEGHLYERAEVPGVAEADPLAHAINDMAVSLEQQVRSSYQERDTFGAVIDSMADALLVVDSDGVVSLANPAATALFPQEDPGIVGKRFMEVVRDFEIARTVNAAVEQGRRQLAQVEHGSDLRLLQVSATPLQVRGGVAALVLIQDLSEMQRLEAMRREFVTNVSHEVRTPLASIKAAVETLQNGALEDPQASAEFFGRIHVELDHMTALTQGLLDLSRIETGLAQFDPEPLEVGPALQEAAERVRPQADLQGLQLSVESPEGLPLASTDRAAFQRILQGLLENALKFTPSPGLVELGASATDGYIEVTVRDTGDGIAEEDLPRIFERFYKADRTRSSVGTGLGLALAKHAVQAQGGDIWAESVPGQGTTIHFTVHAARD